MIAPRHWAQSRTSAAATTYCQDNELSWIVEPETKQLQAPAVHARPDPSATIAVMRRRRFLEGPAKRGGESQLGESGGCHPGTHMTEEMEPAVGALNDGLLQAGDCIRGPDADGRRILDERFPARDQRCTEADQHYTPRRVWSLWHTVC